MTATVETSATAITEAHIETRTSGAADSVRTRRLAMATAAGLGCATLAWRFLTFDGFSNDHYAHLALAQQMLLGDRPVRDFYDPGWPLMYLLSAGGWRLTGNAMWTEWAIASLAFAGAAACTAIAAYRLSFSLPIAIAVTLLEVLIYPRSYAYPKVLAYSMAACAVIAVAARPSATRLWANAAVIALAFLFRHDHGLYVGVASAVAVTVASRREGWRVARNRVATLVAAVVVCLSPWILFIMVNGGLVAYFAGGLEFARAEASANLLRSWPRLVTLAADAPRGIVAFASAVNADAWLFWLFWSLPVACGVVAWRRLASGHERWPGESASVAALILLAVLVNGGILRDVLQTRIPDAVVPAALLGAWAAGLCWSGVWRLRVLQITAQAAALCILTVSAQAAGKIGQVADRAASVGIADGIEGVREHSSMVSHLLSGSHRQETYPPSRYSRALLPFFAYLDRCTSPEDRLIVTGEFPDVLVLAERGFAGDGIVFGAWYTSLAHEDRSIARISTRSTPFALLIGDSSDFRLLDSYLQRHYEPMTEIPVDGAGPVRVLVQRDRPGATTDSETGWHCFR